MNKSTLMGRAAAIALATATFAGKATAQEAGQANEGAGIQEIIVTAQRKEESAQKAGIAIDAVSATTWPCAALATRPPLPRRSRLSRCHRLPPALTRSSCAVLAT
jgi:hypothetical protein